MVSDCAWYYCYLLLYRVLVTEKLFYLSKIIRLSIPLLLLDIRSKLLKRKDLLLFFVWVKGDKRKRLL